MSLSRRAALRLCCLTALTFRASRANAETSALPASALAAAVEYSTRRRGTALVVSQRGVVVAESYPNGGAAGVAQKIYSGTKGFWALGALAAAEEGWLELEERAAETLGEWRGDPRRERITLRQLLNFTSGLENAPELHGERIADRNAAALRVPVVAEPGAAFIYGPASLQVFHEVLKRKLAPRGETPTRFLERKILTPLGLGAQRYLADRAGNPLLATGFMLTARQWLRLGELIVRGGSPVLGARTLAQPFRGSSANGAFGFGFWNNRAAGDWGAREFDFEDMLTPKWFRQNWRNACLCRAAPADLVASIGSGHQRLFVIPSRGLAVVRQGLDGRFSDAEFLRVLLRK